MSGPWTWNQMLGLPVIESRAVPKDTLIMFNHPITNERSLFVFDAWQQLSWPCFLAEQRRLGREHLAKLVRAAETRLFGEVTG